MMIRPTDIRRKNDESVKWRFGKMIWPREMLDLIISVSFTFKQAVYKLNWLASQSTKSDPEWMSFL